MKKLVIFASGSGSNFQAIINAIANNEIEAGIAGLITDREGIVAIDRAAKYHIPVSVIPYFDDHTFTEQLSDQLSEWNPDLVVLAGYLKKIPGKIVDAFDNRIINIHPSLLPKFGGKGFYGERVHQAAIESGETESGCTVHFVDNRYDRGPIIDQKKVPVKPGDTPADLANRILKAEHELLPNVIKRILNQTN